MAGAGVRSLTHLVSYTSDSDEERVKDDEEEEEVMESVELGTIEEQEEEDGKVESDKEEEMQPQLNSGPSLVSYGAEDTSSKPKGSTPSETGESKVMKKAGLVSYYAEDDEVKKEENAEAGGDDHDESWSEFQLSPDDDLVARVKVDNVKHMDSMNFSPSMSLPESALSQKIRRLSAEEVMLPPEPPGRCSRHLQEKINSYYKKNLNLNQIVQRRKDFRNPSIYEKLINYLGVDELGTNYPKDMYDPYSWEESSYYEALAKAQREELQKKKEKDKKEKTKVEFVTGMVRKPQIQAPLVTSTTGTAGASTSTTHGSGTGHEEKKRKSKWDNPVQTLPPPVPLMQRPLISLVTTVITAPTVVSTTTSATGSKTTVISSIGTIKKPKLDK